MYKTTIEKINGRSIVLEYDNEKYEIEYVEDAKVVILRDLLKNKTLKVWSDAIGFIKQVDMDGKTNFVMTEYMKDKDKAILRHYTVEEYWDSLRLVNEFECSTISLKTCCVTDKSYLIEQRSYGSSIYNLSQESRLFYRVYNDEAVKKYFGDNTLMVSERKKAFQRGDINDTITYGINPETFKIITPIWSEHQQRYIEVYTEEQVEKIKERGIFYNDRCSLEELTIKLEIEHYLNELSYYLPKPQSIYLDGYSEEVVNEEFVKHFVKK